MTLSTRVVFINSFVNIDVFIGLQASTTTNQTHAVSTWPPHSQDPVTSLDRPHTISTAYEKGHQRPPLTVYTFQSPDGSTTNEQHPVQKSPANVACRPPLPVVRFYTDTCLEICHKFIKVHFLKGIS